MYLVGEKREHRISNKVDYKLNKRELFAGLSESRQMVRNVHISFQVI